MAHLRIAGPMDRPYVLPRSFTAVLTLALLGFVLVLTGCNTTTVFQSNFDSNSVGQAPAHNQATGTIDVSGAPASVVIVSAPPNATGKWGQISRANQPEAAISVMQCNFSQFQQDGNYGLLAVLYIPSGTSNVATVEFDTTPQGQPPSTGFLHFDFLQNNTVRINDKNDSNHIFGTFPRDQFFTLSVNLQINSSSAKATATLLGSASGSKDIDIVGDGGPLFLARQFGAVKFWMGFPWNGSFDVTDIVITRKK